MNTKAAQYKDYLLETFRKRQGNQTVSPLPDNTTNPLPGSATPESGMGMVGKTYFDATNAISGIRATANRNLLQLGTKLSNMNPFKKPMAAAPEPTAQPTPMPMPSSTPQPIQGNTAADYQAAIEEGYKNWGSPPAATMSAQMASYIDKYPIFKKHPFLLPALTLLESGGGSKMKMPNNPTNWGIYVKDFKPSSMAETIDKTATGIAERMPAYEAFRKSGNLEDLARVYAPESDNPGTGGSNYARNAESIMQVFRSKLKKK